MSRLTERRPRALDNVRGERANGALIALAVPALFEERFRMDAFAPSNNQIAPTDIRLHHPDTDSVHWFAVSAQDDRIAEDVAQALRKRGYSDLRNVSVAVEHACVILRGRVPCYYLKQLAQTAALGIGRGEGGAK